jgi:hypothetical protein
MPDISSLLKSSGINAERTATQLFGTAVEQFATGPINDALKGAFGKPETAVNRTGQDGTWYATSYAHSLANSQFRPKLKFLFRVEFLFKDEVLSMFGAQGAAWLRNFTFMIKSVDRPKVDFEYEEVNQYNFRTKVLRQIKHRALTMTFMDDVGNNVHEFFRFMMFVHSPITRRSIGNQDKGFDIAAQWAQYSTGSGMAFSRDASGTNDFSHRAVLDTDIGNAIKAIKVTQMFMQPGTSREDLSTNAKEVSFLFVNPRVESFDLDDVSHETNDVNVFSMQFDYDFMVMSDMRVLQPLDASKSMPPVGTAPGEAAPQGSGGSKNPQGGNNPYMNILSSVAGRAAQKITNEYLGRQIRKVPGLGGVADTITGLVGSGVSNTVGGLGNTIGSAINQSFARPTRDVVVDASTAGRDVATYTRDN